MNDQKAKASMKQMADKRSYVQESKVARGDMVLIKQKPVNKLTPPYDPRPFIVTSRNGSKIVATRGDQIITRHVNHCKMWRKQYQSNSDVDPSLQDEKEEEINNQNARQVEEFSIIPAEAEMPTNQQPAGQQEGTPPRPRDRPPRRNAKKPARYREEEEETA